MDTEKYNLTEDDLDRKGRILVLAEEIKSDDKVYRAVTQHMMKKANKIKRIAQLRDKMANEDLSNRTGRSPNNKETESPEVEDEEDVLEED